MTTPDLRKIFDKVETVDSKVSVYVAKVVIPDHSGEIASLVAWLDEHLPKWSFVVRHTDEGLKYYFSGKYVQCGGLDQLETMRRFKALNSLPSIAALNIAEMSRRYPHNFDECFSLFDANTR